MTRRLLAPLGMSIGLLVASGCAPEGVQSDVQLTPTSTATTAPSSTSTVATLPEVTGSLVAHAIGETIEAYETPPDQALDDDALVAVFDNPTDRGGPLVFQVDGDLEDASDVTGEWLRVKLPIRPNGTTGWIPTDAVDLTTNPYRIVVDVDDFSLQVLREDEVVIDTTIAVGDGDTPTPIGDFYLIELLKPFEPDGAYGPYAYGLSGYSDTLQSFNGGEGVIGIHGTNQPAALGGNVSHGCIRVENSVITEMAGFLPLGTPVEIGYG